MSIWDTILGRAPQQFKLADTSVKHIIPKVPQLDKSVQSLTGYATKSELVYACIEKKAQVATDPVLIIQEKKGDDWKDIKEHPALDVLNEPNAWDDGNTFLRTWIASENIAGEFYAEIVRSKAGTPAQLYPLRPDYLYPQYVSRNGVEALDHYLYRINGKEVKFYPDDLLIYRRHGLGSMFSGVSPLYVALNPVDADLASTEYIRAFFNNGGTPSGIITVKDRTLSEDQAAALQQKWVTRYGRGGRMRGGPAVLDQSAEYQPTGSNLDELNSEILTQFDETRICMAFGVPPVLIGAYVGLKNVNQKASFKGALEEFWMNTMSPELKQLRQYLTRKFLPLFGEDERVQKGEIRFFWDMSNVDAMQEDIDAVHDRIALGWKSGLYKFDEARVKLGLKPIGGEEGELFYTAPAPIEGEEEEPEEEEGDTKNIRDRILNAKLLTNGNGQKKTFDYVGLTLSREPTELELSIDLKAIADSYESGKDSMLRVILGLRDDLIDQAVIAVGKRTAADVFTLTLVPPKNAYKQISKEVERSVTEGQRQISKNAPKSSHPDEFKSEIDDIIKRLTELTVSRIINAVQTAAVDVFTALGVLGFSDDEIEADMRVELEERSEKPFEGFARQATNEAVNEGRRVEMEARSDQIEKYVYSAILDANTCGPCEAWDGAEADDPGQLPETPNAECEGGSNCRCFIISVWESEAKE